MPAVKHMLGYGLVQVEKSKVLNHAVVCMYLVMVAVTVDPCLAPDARPQGV